MAGVRACFGMAGCFWPVLIPHVRHPPHENGGGGSSIPEEMHTMEDSTSPATTTTRHSEPQRFLSLAADYQIAADSESTSLMDDTAAFLECAREAVSTIANGLEDKTSDIAANPTSAAIVLHGVRRFIEMAASNVSVVNRRLIVAEQT